MVGMTDITARGIIAQVTGKAAIYTLPNPAYVGLMTADPGDASTSNEVSGNGYNRVSAAAAAWNAAGGSAPATISNASAITFPAATGAGWGTVLIAGLFDAASAGNLLFWDYLGAFDWLPFTCTSASPGVLTAPAHGFSNADTVVVTAEFGGALPTTGGSWTGTKTVAGVTTDTFTAGVNTTGTGNGMVRKVVGQSVPAGVTVSFAIGQLVLKAA